MTHPIPDEALDEDIAILGRKGGGKSYTAKGIVERLLDMGRRVLVLDPLGVWAGLRTSADGEHAGYPVAIFGGLHADLPLDPAAAEPMARIIAAENLPAVVDLSELSKSAQQSFLLKFLHELRRVNKEALTVVLEEADVFAPQNPQGDDSKALHGEIDWIARRGRFKGFRLLTITQRPARLSKDVLTQANMVIMHRLPAPQDRDAAKAWVDGNGDRDQAKVVFDTLAGLKVGEAWVLAQDPAMLERVAFPRIKTLDTSATPKAGETRVEPKTLAQVDVTAIRAALAVPAIPTNPAQNIPGNIPDPAVIAAAEHRGYERGRSAALIKGAEAIEALMHWTMQRVADFEKEMRGQFAGMMLPDRLNDAPEQVAKPAQPRPEKRPPAPVLEASASATPALPPSLQRALDSIAWWHAIGFEEVQRSHAAIAAGLSPTASTFNVYVSKLSERGLVEASSPGQVRLTADGRSAAKPMPEASIVAMARELLDPQPARVFDLVLAAHPSSISRGDLADQMGLSRTASTLNVYISKASRLGLVKALPNSMVRAADFLFPGSA